MTLAFFSVMTLGILVNWFAGALLAFTIFFYVVIYTIGAEALDRAEHRDRRRRRRAAAGGGVGGGDRLAVDRAAAAVPDHLLLDPAAFLGAGAVPQRRLCARRACRCCRWSPVPTRRGCRSCSTPSCWSRSPSRPGRSAISTRSMASPRWCSAPACWRSRSTSTATARAAPALRATRKLFAFSILYLFALFATLLLEVVVRAVAPSIW